LGFLIFAVGFIVGMLTVALTLVVVKLTRASHSAADHDGSRTPQATIDKSLS
jgi:hypothetical protein